MFLRILRAFLTRAAQMAPSLAELRAVLADILSVYSFEQDVLALANELLASDLFVDARLLKAIRQNSVAYPLRSRQVRSDHASDLKLPNAGLGAHASAVPSRGARPMTELPPRPCRPYTPHR